MAGLLGVFDRLYSSRRETLNFMLMNIQYGAIWGGGALIACDVFEHCLYHKDGPGSSEYIDNVLLNLHWGKDQRALQEVLCWKISGWTANRRGRSLTFVPFLCFRDCSMRNLFGTIEQNPPNTLRQLLLPGAMKMRRSLVVLLGIAACAAGSFCQVKTEMRLAEEVFSDEAPQSGKGLCVGFGHRVHGGTPYPVRNICFVYRSEVQRKMIQTLFDQRSRRISRLNSKAGSFSAFERPRELHKLNNAMSGLADFHRPLPTPRRVNLSEGRGDRGALCGWQGHLD